MENFVELTIYDIPRCSYLGLKIINGCMTLISEIQAGDAGDIVNHYELSKEETEKFFNIMSLNEFLDFGKKEKSIRSVLKLLDDKEIKYSTRSF